MLSSGVVCGAMLQGEPAYTRNTRHKRNEKTGGVCRDKYLLEVVSGPAEFGDLQIRHLSCRRHLFHFFGSRRSWYILERPMEENNVMRFRGLI